MIKLALIVAVVTCGLAVLIVGLVVALGPYYRYWQFVRGNGPGTWRFYPPLTSAEKIEMAMDAKKRGRYLWPRSLFAIRWLMPPRSAEASVLLGRLVSP